LNLVELHELLRREFIKWILKGPNKIKVDLVEVVIRIVYGSFLEAFVIARKGVDHRRGPGGPKPELFPFLFWNFAFFRQHVEGLPLDNAQIGRFLLIEQFVQKVGLLKNSFVHLLLLSFVQFFLGNELLLRRLYRMLTPAQHEELADGFLQRLYGNRALEVGHRGADVTVKGVLLVIGRSVVFLFLNLLKDAFVALLVVIRGVQPLLAPEGPAFSLFWQL